MNENLFTYLQHYCSLSAPKYAVLVKGPWGSGKTFQVKAAIAAIETSREYKADPQNPDSPIWVSLYGLNHPDALDAAIVAASDKSATLGIGGMRMLGDLSRGIGGVFAAGAIASELVGPILRRSLKSNAHRTLIIDDLERCTMPLEQSLGAINYYVEELGFKAILIAHEDKISSQLSERKEKLIGQTLTVTPDYDASFNEFIREIEDPEAQTFLNSYKTELIFCFERAGIASLRIVKHVLFDLARLHRCLTSEQLEHGSATNLLVGKLSIINALFREGAFDTADIAEFSEKLFAVRMERARIDSSRKNGREGAEQKAAEPDRFTKSIERLDQAGYSLYETPFPNVFMKNMIVDGHYDRPTIQKVLEESGMYGSALEDRSWWRVWHRRERSDAEVQQDIATLEADFVSRKFTQPEDILHMFSLRLTIATDGLLPGRTSDGIVTECKSYLDDLLILSALPAAKNERPFEQLGNFSGAYGLGYASNYEGSPDLARFQELIETLSVARQTALRNTYSARAGEIIECLRSNSKEGLEQIKRMFFEEMNDQPSLAKLPIFTDEKPNTILEVLLISDGSIIFAFAELLSSRYYGTNLHNGLDSEIDWIIGLHELVEKKSKAPCLSAVLRWRLKMFVD